MEKKRTSLKALIAVLVLAVILGAVYVMNRPKTQTGAKNIIVEVKNDRDETKTYEWNTDAEYLSAVLDELVKTGTFSYEASESTYGLYITSINGLAADYEKDQAYWAIYVNGEYGNFGADQQPVTDKDTYSFVYEKAQ